MHVASNHSRELIWVVSHRPRLIGVAFSHAIKMQGHLGVSKLISFSVRLSLSLSLIHPTTLGSATGQSGLGLGGGLGEYCGVLYIWYWQ